MTKRKKSKQRVRARDVNWALGAAYDLLHKHEVPFYNDKLEATGRHSEGRSLKPYWEVSQALHFELSVLADAVSLGVSDQDGNRPARYHFYVEAR
jgi:hypothetical protein